MRFFVVACFLSVGLLYPNPSVAYAIPVNDGFVTDSSGLLTSEQEKTIEQTLSEYREQTSNEIAIVIVKSMDGEVISDHAVDILRKWGVGTSANNNGVVLLIAYEDRDLFIATGYGLEGAIPDLVAHGIIEEDILPYFRQGDYFSGIQNGIASIQKHIGGEYSADRFSDTSTSGIDPFFIMLFFVALNAFVSFLARTKSWWLGGVCGLLVAIVLAFKYGWWLSIPFLTIVGLLFDYVLSKAYASGALGRSRSSRFRGFGGRGGGGFGGFSGGSGGGGGAGGSW